MRQIWDFSGIISFSLQPNSWLPSDDSESVGQKLKVHSKDQRNFKDFNKTPMSKTLIQKFAEFSSAYIIPRPGKKSRVVPHIHIHTHIHLHHAEIKLTNVSVYIEQIGKIITRTKLDQGWIQLGKHG